MLKIVGQSLYAVRCRKGWKEGEPIALSYTEAFEQVLHNWTCPMCGGAADFDMEGYDKNLLKVLKK